MLGGKIGRLSVQARSYNLSSQSNLRYTRTPSWFHEGFPHSESRTTDREEQTCRVIS